ncbi:MAG: hypothetical protein IT406_03710 [Candidatus Yanofskybacteria bacterium]|nr:hypothetical protein [Candidatus Yanofskybacteria bacterium]
MGDFKPPRDNANFRWTHHVVRKLRFYALTPSRVLRVIRAPERVEDGVAEGTLAAMQTAGTKAKPWEVWVMWREEGKRRVVITAWRYPGVSPVRERVPLPAGVLAELESEGLLDA